MEDTNMRTRILLVSSSLFCAALAFGQTEPKSAHATIVNAQGQKIGSAALKSTSKGVRISVRVSDLPAGTHAFHIHAAGSCEGPDFKSAGGHFNPEGKMHGTMNPAGSHAGDLPNFTVGADGKAHFTVVAQGVILGDGPNSLFHEGGTSLVIHEKADDYKTDPAGNAGARIACGVIEK
jgi:Cu-Zn family superoxide dismutase